MLVASGASAGLVSDGNGGLLLNGRPWRGVGVNYVAPTQAVLADGSYTPDAHFAKLAEEEVPFVRLWGQGFWPTNNALYESNKTEYFNRLDKVVESAENHGVGVVMTIFWNVWTTPNMVGEGLGQWANPNSATRAHMETYVEEVVTRYRNSSAIWAWEFANEFNLRADLPNLTNYTNSSLYPTVTSNGQPATRGPADFLDGDGIYAAKVAFHDAVRLHDPDRIVFTGDSTARESTWHNTNEGTWTQDTRQQWLSMMFTRDNPLQYESTSFHLYPHRDGDYFAGENVSIEELATAIVDHAELNDAVSFLGEFGPLTTTDPTAAQQMATWDRFLQLIEDTEVDISAAWAYGPDNSATSWMHLEDPANDYVFEMLRATNIAIAVGGPGDANGDGLVDVSDLGIMATYYDAGGGHGWEHGDFTGDGFVDVADLGILAIHYGETEPVASVPEASMLTLLLACGLTLLGLGVQQGAIARDCG